MIILRRPFQFACISLVVMLITSIGLPQLVAQYHGHSMFNGIDLSQWEKANGDDVDRGWVVENGTIFRKEQGGDIYYRQPHQDFIFLFEWKISENGNSGIKYRMRQYNNSWLGCEYQIEHRPNENEAAGGLGKQSTGGLYAVYEPGSNRPPVEPGIWYRGKIQVINNRIQHWVNDVLVVDAIVGSEDWEQRVQASKFRNNEGFGKNQSGRIMLQDHGNQVWYRNLVMIPIHHSGSGIAQSPVSDHSIRTTDRWGNACHEYSGPYCQPCPCCCRNEIHYYRPCRTYIPIYGCRF